MRNDTTHNVIRSADRALIVGPNPDVAREMQKTLIRQQWHVTLCESLDELRQQAEASRFPLVIVLERADCRIAESVLETLRPEIKADRTQVAIFSESPSVKDTLYFLKRGAACFRA